MGHKSAGPVFHAGSGLMARNNALAKNSSGIVIKITIRPIV